MTGSASRRPGSERGRPAIDWLAAFVFFASLPAESRSYAAVADRFGVSRRTVETHGQRASGQVRITASDLVGLIKVSLQLHGEPASRVELVTGSAEWLALRTRILEALGAFPEAQFALTEALAADEQ